MSEDYYGKFEKLEITAQLVLAAIIFAERNCNNAHSKVSCAWDVAEIFQKERDERVSKMRNAQAAGSS